MNWILFQFIRQTNRIPAKILIRYTILDPIGGRKKWTENQRCLWATNP